jgi:hypothetical protein
LAKYFKLFKGNGLDKIEKWRDFRTRNDTERNIYSTYTTVTFPELVGANLFDMQHSTRG